MKLITSFLLLLFLPIISLAQQGYDPSLMESKIEELWEDFYSEDYAEVLIACESLIPLIEVEIDVKNLSDIKSLQASTLRQLGKIDLSLELHQEVLRLRKSKKGYGPFSKEVGSTYLNIGNCLVELEDFDEAIFYFQKANELFERNNPNHIKALNGLGECYRRKKQFNISERYFKRAQRIAENYLPFIDPLRMQVQAYYFNLLFESGKRNLAIEKLETLIQNQKIFPEKSTIDLIINLTTLCGFLTQTGDYQKAIAKGKEALQTIDKEDIKNPFLIINTLQNLGNAFRDSGEFELAKQHYSTAIELTKLNSEEQNNILMEMAILARFQGNWLESEQYSEQVLGFYERQEKLNKIKWALALESLANSYFEQGKGGMSITYFEAAIRYFSEALDVFEKVSGREETVAKISNKIGLCHLELNQLKAAKSYFQKAHTLIPKENIGLKLITLQHLASLKKIENDFEEALNLLNQCLNLLGEDESKNPYEQIQIYTTFAAIWTEQSKQSKKREDWEQVIFYSQKAIQLLEKLKGNFEILTSEIDLNHLFYDVYNYQIDALLFLHEINPKGGFDRQAFQQTEYYKGTLLRKLVPERSPTDSDVVTISDIQNKLKVDQTFIEFQWANERIYLFLINQKEYLVHSISYPDSIKNRTLSLFNECSIRPDLGGSKQLSRDEQLVNQSVFLYNKIIRPVESKLNKNILVVPDTWLFFLPFDALIIQPAKDASRFRSHKYLFQSHAISYSFSGKEFLKSDGEKKRNFKKTFLAIGPNFKNHRELKFLEFNDDEALLTSEIMKGDVWLDSMALERHFKINASDYQIILLATHGVLKQEQPDSSFIAFTAIDRKKSEGYLTIPEIRELNLNAELIVLSACRTLDGLPYRGEGLLGIGHSFFQAGVPSLVASLWNVDDEQTPNLMGSFFKNLKSKQPKSIALQNAKLDYLTSSFDQKSHPFYWSGFMAFGDIAPLSFSNFGWIWLLGFVVAIALVLYIRKQKNNNHQEV